jgi:hypothetical protein
VPADKKWFRNLPVAETLRDALMPYKEGWIERLKELGSARRTEIEEYKATIHETTRIRTKGGKDISS